MNKRNLLGALAAPLIMLALTATGYADSPAAPTTCKDGTTSDTSGRGACSGHGGVQKAAKSTTTAPNKGTPAAATAMAATPAPAGAMSASAPASTTAMKSTTAMTAAPAAAGNTDPTGATAKCKDGTYSKSAHHTGACSKHGGVDSFMGASQ